MRHQIQLPITEHHHLTQSEAFFYLVHENGEREKIAFHDYGRIFSIPGLYEQIFSDRLRCQSPQVVGAILHQAVESTKENFNALRVLDLGAGNGLMGEVLQQHGVARMVGVDIEHAAKVATMRDRRGVYDEYYIDDLTKLAGDRVQLYRNWSFDCLTTVAALGFSDIPVRAFFQAINLVREDGWIAFNIKETFLKPSDATGFSSFIRSLILSEHMDVYTMKRYCHRLSMEGVPLYYYAIVAKKRQDIPETFVENC